MGRARSLPWLRSQSARRGPPRGSPRQRRRTLRRPVSGSRQDPGGVRARRTRPPAERRSRRPRARPESAVPRGAPRACARRSSNPSPPPQRPRPRDGFIAAATRAHCANHDMAAVGGPGPQVVPSPGVRPDWWGFRSARAAPAGGWKMTTSPMRGRSRECPRNCVGMSERDRHVYENEQGSEQDRVGAGRGA